MVIITGARPPAPIYREPTTRLERDQHNQYSIVFVGVHKLELEHVRRYMSQEDVNTITSRYPEMFYFHSFAGHHVLKPGNKGEMDIEGDLTALSATPYRSSICGHLLLDEVHDNPELDREKFHKQNVPRKFMTIGMNGQLTMRADFANPHYMNSRVVIERIKEYYVPILHTKISSRPVLIPEFMRQIPPLTIIALNELRTMRRLHQKGDLSSTFEFYDKVKELFEQSGGQYGMFVPDVDLDLLPRDYPSLLIEYPLYA